MKLTWKGYWKPTPKIIRKVADSILAGATLASTFAVVNDHSRLAVVIMVVSVVAKVVSNFFTNEPTS